MSLSRRKRILFRLLNFYPPYFGARIRVVEVDPSGHRYVVAMNLSRFNRNYFGSHFGGSLYSMCDPWFALILAESLGPDFVVWDKAATIRFRKPGMGRVTATFALDAQEIARVRAAALAAPKFEPVYQAQVVDARGVVVAEVEKTLYVRRR